MLALLPIASILFSASALGAALWQPAPVEKFQIVLNQEVSMEQEQLDTSVGIYDIDMFINSAASIEQLHAMGRKVICYFSAGTYEPYRPDFERFQDSDMGSILGEWPDERWLRLDSENVRSIMLDRLKTAKERGCDGVDPDNMGECVFMVSFTPQESGEGPPVTKRSAID